MIDLHTHILPNIDDGAGSVKEALDLIQILRMQEVSKAVCTPHFDPTQLSMEDFIAKRTKAIHLLEGEEMFLLAGSETMLHEYLFYYPDLDELCIENSRYLLLELFPGDRWNQKTYLLLKRLISTYGVIPVIAHIERYHKRNKGFRFIKKLIRFGCVIQVNTSSIIDSKYRKLVIRYMKLGLIDVLGSDCHSIGKRPPIISEAQDIITRELGTEYYRKLIDNAECIIRGTSIRGMYSYII